MTRPVPDPARSGVAYPLRLLPGLGGTVAGTVAALLLSRWSADDVAAVVATAGLAEVDRASFVAAAGVLTGVVVWAALYLVWGRGGWRDRPWRREVRRPPLSFADLGPPPPREQPLPSDLDQPLSAFDPDAIEFYQRRLR